MTLNGRDDNRMYQITALDLGISEVNLQATGREPLMFRVENFTCYVSYDKNNWILLEEGLYMYERAHPFGGQFYLKKGSGLATLTFMVGGAI
jgi:hypothetical protein